MDPIKYKLGDFIYWYSESRPDIDCWDIGYIYKVKEGRLVCIWLKDEDYITVLPPSGSRRIIRLATDKERIMFIDKYMVKNL